MNSKSATAMHQTHVLLITRLPQYFSLQHFVSQTRKNLQFLFVKQIVLNDFTRCLICYNNLPLQFDNANSLFSFKRLLKSTN